MIYFLDFDRTLFDTDSFVDHFKTRDDSRELRSLSFAPGELSSFLYPDAAQFLRDKENAAMVITYGDPIFQKAKIQSALAGIPRISVIYTDLVRKGEFLAPNIGNYGPSILVDDQPEELALLSEVCPGIDLYEMRRDGGVEDGRFKIIRTLAELP